MNRACRALVLLVLAACGSKEPPPVTSTTLDRGVVARVDGEGIAVETVAAIAGAQGVDRKQALELALFDALLAREATERGLAARAGFQARTALIRPLLADLAREARAQGRPTDAEVEEQSDYSWLDVKRPEAVCVVHAVVMLPPVGEATEEQEAAALSLARAIHKAVQPARDAVSRSKAPDLMVKPGAAYTHDPIHARFEQLAMSVERGALKVVAQPLLPIGADGYGFELEGRVGYDEAFVKAAFMLQKRGDMSEPVRGVSGYHVILLLDRLPSQVLPLAQRRDMFEQRIYAERAQKRLQALLAEARASTRPEVERSADELLSWVKVGR